MIVLAPRRRRTRGSGSGGRPAPAARRPCFDGERKAARYGQRAPSTGACSARCSLTLPRSTRPTPSAPGDRRPGGRCDRAWSRRRGHARVVPSPPGPAEPDAPRRSDRRLELGRTLLSVVERPFGVAAPEDGDDVHAGGARHRWRPRSRRRATPSRIERVRAVDAARDPRREGSAGGTSEHHRAGPRGRARVSRPDPRGSRRRAAPPSGPRHTRSARWSRASAPAPRQGSPARTLPSATIPNPFARAPARTSAASASGSTSVSCGRSVSTT